MEELQINSWACVVEADASLNIMVVGMLLRIIL